MKTTGNARKAGKFFAMIAAGLALAAGAASAQGLPAGMNDALTHCGCDNEQGIKMYVDSIVSDAQQRGLSREQAKIHSAACIAVWCSICAGHSGLAERCITTATAYFDAAPGFDEQQPAVAGIQ